MKIESKKDTTGRFMASAICFILFLQTLIMALFFDVKPIGPIATNVGCSTINNTFFQITGTNIFLYNLTTYLGVLAIIAVAIFAIMGLIQLIKRKSLKKVDTEILLLGGLYLFIFLLYGFFELVIVNYRPVLMTGEYYPSASFPSSHTVLIVVVMGSVILVADRYIKKTALVKPVQILCGVIMGVTVIGRLFCGVHWFTDIAGGIWISAALILLFSALLDRYADPAMSRKNPLTEDFQ